LRTWGGVSAADFVKDALGLLQLKMPDIEEIKETAWGEGYDQAKKGYQIWYYCNVCRERIDMEPNSESHKAMIGYYEGAWLGARKLSPRVALTRIAATSSDFFYFPFHRGKL